MPGGYIELVEVEFPGRRYGPKSKAIADKSLLRVSEKGFDANLAMNLKELLRCAGLTEIVSTYISMPVGDWNMSDNYIGESCKKCKTQTPIAKTHVHIVMPSL